MISTLLATKFFFPELSPHLVARPRLIERINAGLTGKLILVSAPAGFGKTTLVREWMDQVRRDAADKRPEACQIAWLSLDEGDNDPANFLAYLITAINQLNGRAVTIGDTALGMLQSSQQAPAEVILTSLINDATALPQDVVLVLDDYHVIESTSVDDAMAFLLDHIPPKMHLVIATREDPHLPLAKLRAQGQLTELRAMDLRFTSAECARFLNRAMSLDLAAQEIQALEARTEGWIAGLQLAAISMQGHSDTTAFIKSFTGSHYFVLDFLVEEVLEQQPESLQGFLMTTSILDRLNGSLCNALTGQDSGQSTLEELEHANLFITPLDDERHWYRYHHLFADLLRKRLRQTRPESIPLLHRRASAWHAQNGSFPESIEHAIQAEAFESAANLIEDQIDVYWSGGQHIKLRRWLSKLPDQCVLSRPNLSIIQAWYLFTSGQPVLAEKCLQTVSRALERAPAAHVESGSNEKASPPTDDLMRLRGRTAAIRAFMDSHRGDVPGIIRNAGEALDHLPEQDRTWRSMTAIVLSDTHGFKGDMTAAYQARLEALNACEETGDVYYIILAGVKLAITLRAQGKLQSALKLCQEHIHLANESGLARTSLTGLLLMIEAEALAELDDLDRAYDQAIKGLELIDRGVDLAVVGWGYMCLLRVLFSRRAFADIERIFQKIGEKAEGSNVPPWIINQVETWQIRLRLEQKDLKSAIGWARRRGIHSNGASDPPHELDYFSLLDYVMFARVLIAHNRFDEANDLLECLLAQARSQGRTARVIEILLLQALADQARGQTVRALSALEQALAIAEPEGFIRVFVDEGAKMAQLLSEAVARRIAPEYTRQLLTAFRQVATSARNSAGTPAGTTELIEPLSDRETEVLQLIAKGLTNQEIAARLFLSLNTVKVHNRNIYSKLATHSRTQAVARGRELGILTSQ